MVNGESSDGERPTPPFGAGGSEGGDAADRRAERDLPSAGESAMSAPDAAMRHKGTSARSAAAVFEGRSQRAGRFFMLGVRIIFMVLLVTVTMLIVSSNRNPGDYKWTVFGFVVVSTLAGLIAIVADALTPNKRLASVVGVYIGIAVGLVAAVAFGSLIDMVMSAWDLRETESLHLYTNLAKVVIGLVICYLTVAVVLSTKDDFRLVIPYVEFARQRRGLRPMLVDSSALIDGRVRDLSVSGFLDAPLVVPRFVLEELQKLADSADRAKRLRGKRGLDLVAELQRTPEADVSVEDFALEGMPVDHMLLEVARKEGMRILTTDSNLQKIGGIQGITVLNLHQLAAAVRPVAAVGDPLTITIARVGENAGQGVGYLPDGTMVVVEDAASRVGESLEVSVTNTLQTQAGRLVFARWEPRLPDGNPSALPRMADAATNQPRIVSRPPMRGDGAPPRGRNPRR